MKKIEACRVCGSSELLFILSLGSLHLSAFLDPGVETPRYPLTLVLCPKCRLVQLEHTVPAGTMYEQYWYKSGTNASMTKELKSIAMATRGLQLPGDVVLDIGCNDGTLLRAYEENVYRVGFEPAKNLLASAREGTDLIINDFFSAGSWFEKLKHVKAKIVTTIAMFYDLDDPNTFVKDVYEVLADDGVWIIQMADLKSMLERTMWDNICHEHLEYYSLASLEYLLKKHGFAVDSVEQNDVNGGSIRVFVVKESSGSVPQESVERFRRAETELGLDTFKPYDDFEWRVDTERRALVNFVKEEKLKGKTICVYGASTKGNTLLQYTGLDHSYITAAAERNPDKWGKVTVGTNIPIVSEQEVRDMKPDYMLVLPWHFLDEFVEREKTYLREGGAFIAPLPTFKVIRR